ncbi:hypothetical protein ACFLST_01995 [Chloroflexota bacterium]
MGLDIVVKRGKLAWGQRVEVVAGLFLLLFVAVLIRSIGNRLVPLVMPRHRLKTIAVGFGGGVIGGLVDQLTWKLSPELVGVHLVAGVAGCVLAILVYGLIPFLRIMIGRA